MLCEECGMKTQFSKICDFCTKKHVKETYENGDKYEGEICRNKKHGFGILTYANGEKYEGEWKENMMHGFGTMTYKNGDNYEGDW